MAQARSSLSAVGSSSPTRVRGKSTGVRSRDQSGVRSDAADAAQKLVAKWRHIDLEYWYIESGPESHGGENALGLATAPPRDNPVEQIRGGYDYSSITQLADAFDTTMEATISVLGLPRSTIKKKQMDAQPLSPAISDQIYRAKRVFARCMDLFSEKEAANRWLQRGHPSLHGATPLSLLDTTAGYEMVLDELERINNGVPV